MSSRKLRMFSFIFFPLGVKHASNTRYDVDGPPARAVEGSTEGSQQQQPHDHQHHPSTHPSLKQQPPKQHVAQLPVLPGTISHYGFSVDIRSIRNVNTSSALNIYIRYSLQNSKTMS